MSEERYYPRSASDKTDNWPYWFVADRQSGGLNVTPGLISTYLGWDPRGVLFLSKKASEKLANIANGERNGHV